MKFVRFLRDGRDVWGIVDGDTVVEVRGSIFGDVRPTAVHEPLERVRLLAPVVPSKIIGVGLNYRDHAAETHQPVPTEPLLFLKAPSAIVGPEDPIVLPFADHEVHPEAELAFVIKRRAKNVTRQDAFQYILGYTCANDVSDRTIQNPQKARSQAKSLDTFAPLGPVLVTDLDPTNLNVQCLVNGKVRQSSNTGQLVFDVPTLVAHISSLMTLFPGDVVLTGTPSGIGPIYPGDVVEVCVAGIGTLRNPVRAA